MESISVSSSVRQSLCVVRPCACVRAAWCQRLNRLSDFHGIRSKGSFQNSVEQECISWKSAHWLPYFTYGPQWVSPLLSTYIDLMCMKFSSDVHLNPLKSSECHENRYNESCMLLWGVNEVLPYLIILCSNLGDNRQRMFPQKFFVIVSFVKTGTMKDEVKNWGSVHKTV